MSTGKKVPTKIYKAHYQENVPAEIDGVGEFYALSFRDVVSWAREHLEKGDDGDAVEITAIIIAPLQRRKLIIACLNRRAYLRDFFLLFRLLREGDRIIKKFGEAA